MLSARSLIVDASRISILSSLLGDLSKMLRLRAGHLRKQIKIPPSRYGKDG
jgi:hypothetical protein